MLQIAEAGFRFEKFSGAPDSKIKSIREKMTQSEQKRSALALRLLDLYGRVKETRTLDFRGIIVIKYPVYTNPRICADLKDC